MKKKKYKVMLISGGFDPVHKGHLEMIAEARKLASEVWVILNNDRWLSQKKGKEFMNEDEREYIMSQVKGVTKTFICHPRIPTDKTVCDAIYSAVNVYRREFNTNLEEMSMAFGNGGDRIEGNIPESEYCDSMGVDMVWGLGKKIQSSSWLLERANNQEIDYNIPPSKYDSKFKMVKWSLIGLGLTILYLIIDTHLI